VIGYLTTYTSNLLNNFLHGKYSEAQLVKSVTLGSACMLRRALALPEISQQQKFIDRNNFVL